MIINKINKANQTRVYTRLVKILAPLGLTLEKFIKKNRLQWKIWYLREASIVF